jgi:hypothetical protein
MFYCIAGGIHLARKPSSPERHADFTGGLPETNLLPYSEDINDELVQCKLGSTY